MFQALIPHAILERGPRFTALVAATLGAIGSISAAWGFQLIGGFIPCALCYAQRTPYYLAIPLLVLALAADWSWRLTTPLRGGSGAGAQVTSPGGPTLPRLQVGIILLAAAILAYGAGLGAYQAGAEWGFWEGPRDCATAGAAAVTKAGDLLSAMAQTRIVSCTEVQLRILGLSFAGWNAVISAGLVGLCLVGALWPHRDRLAGRKVPG